MAPAAMISHRGCWWPDRRAENSLKAIADAFAAGYGVEVDVRQLDGQFVLAHDLPVLDSDRDVCPSWDAFLDLAYQSSPDLPLLINVKEAGTETKIAWDLRAWGLHTRAYLFDFELCGANPLKTKAVAPEVRCLARLSDKAGTGIDPGVAPFLPGWAYGLWVDPWDRDDWATAELLNDWRWAVGPIFIVAPDLHGRLVDFKLLEQWRGAEGICSDLCHLIGPVLAGDERLHPKEPWWGA